MNELEKVQKRYNEIIEQLDYLNEEATNLESEMIYLNSKKEK